MELAWAEQVWAWIGKELAVFGLRWLVVLAILLGFGGFIGRRYKELKREIGALRGSQSPVTVQNVFGIERSGTTKLIDPAAHPKSFDPPEARFRALEPQIEAFAEGAQNRHDRIWELHIALGDIGIAWPGPGVTPEFRRAVSKKLLAACQNGDIEAARTAWARAQPKEKPNA